MKVKKCRLSPAPLLSHEVFIEYSDNSTVALFYRYIVVSKHEKDLRLLLNRLRREAEGKQRARMLKTKSNSRPPMSELNPSHLPAYTIGLPRVQHV